jgi:hypothetical protein
MAFDSRKGDPTSQRAGIFISNGRVAVTYRRMGMVLGDRHSEVNMGVGDHAGIYPV